MDALNSVPHAGSSAGTSASSDTSPGGLDPAHVPAHMLVSSPSDTFHPDGQPSTSTRRGSRRRTSVASESSGTPETSDDPKQFVCQQCNRGFARLLHLQRHEYRHVNYRPFECPWCEKTFSRHDSLVRHARLHREKLEQEPKALSKLKACMNCTEEAKCGRCAQFSRRSSSTKAARKPSSSLAVPVSVPTPAPAPLAEPVEPAKPVAPAKPTKQTKSSKASTTEGISKRATGAKGLKGAKAKGTGKARQAITSSQPRTPKSNLATTGHYHHSRTSLPMSSLGLDSVPTLSPSSRSSDEPICPPTPQGRRPLPQYPGFPGQPYPAHLAQTAPKSSHFQGFPLAAPLPPPEVQMQSFAFDSASGQGPPQVPPVGVPPNVGVAPDTSQEINTLPEQGMFQADSTDTHAQMATIRAFMHDNMVAYLARRLPPMALDDPLPAPAHLAYPQPSLQPLQPLPEQVQHSFMLSQASHLFPPAPTAPSAPSMHATLLPAHGHLDGWHRAPSVSGDSSTSMSVDHVQPSVQPSEPMVGPTMGSSATHDVLMGQPPGPMGEPTGCDSADDDKLANASYHELLAQVQALQQRLEQETSHEPDQPSMLHPNEVYTLEPEMASYLAPLLLHRTST